MCAQVVTGFRAAVAASVMVMAGWNGAAVAAQPDLQAAAMRTPAPVHIRNHRGGFLPHIVAEMQSLVRSGAEVRIDGGFCFSACTVFLASDRVCVAPWTQFGFHAPSNPQTRRKLTGQAFEHATRHVARYYNPQLARWWMNEGRHTRQGLAMLTGADLIAMGYRACSSQGVTSG
ncbi:hypothetical protein [Rhodobaculum claviforme]|uniref:Uncharacterized protein n=1 Tax=Rhodobaculum claviforme TaxID=1549854 RepID=A0A934WIU1_9RHOB|nr:hypothetical protein [Rhodobaculum claviforme]MBK5927212.1 hypothetical protein [Rhodobaculum claviforme]